jgi:hypothetical protein
VATLVVLEETLEDKVVVGNVAFSFVSVTMQYDVHSYHGSQLVLREGFQATNSAGVMPKYFRTWSQVSPSSLLYHSTQSFTVSGSYWYNGEPVQMDRRASKNIDKKNDAFMVKIW